MQYYTEFYKKFEATQMDMQLDWVRRFPSHIFFKKHEAPQSIGRFELTPALIAFHSEIEEVYTKWILRDQNLPFEYLDKDLDFVMGSFSIVTLNELANIKSDADFLTYIDPYSMFDDSDRISLLNFIPFHYEEGDYCVCAKKDSTNLFYVDFSDEGKIFDLQVDIKTYLEVGMEHYFFYGWQKAAFLNNEKLQKSIAYYLPRLFPKIEQ
jgi:hypothetical protein